LFPTWGIWQELVVKDLPHANLANKNHVLQQPFKKHITVSFLSIRGRGGAKNSQYESGYKAILYI